MPRQTALLRLLLPAIALLPLQTCTDIFGPCPPVLRIKSGNNQVGRVNTLLARALVVEPHGGATCPAIDFDVEWTVTAGGGSLALVNHNGTIPHGERTWTLGPTLGTQTVRAIQILPHRDTVFFTATAQQ